MKLQIDKIPEEGLHLSVEESAQVLGFKNDPIFKEDGSVCAELYVQLVDETLIVRGEVRSEIKAQCARCSSFFSTTVKDSGFLRDYSDVGEGDEVDITDDLREAILLNLPRFPLCSEDCKGLCMSCGKNLNDGSCDCSSGNKGGAWDALDNLNL